MKKAHRLDQVQASLTLAITAKAAAMRAGEEIAIEKGDAL